MSEEPEHLDEIVESYALSPEQVSALNAAEADYWIGIEADYDEQWVRNAARLVAAIGELADGLVVDLAAGEFLSAGEWSRRHAGGSP